MSEGKWRPVIASENTAQELRLKAELRAEVADAVAQLLFEAIQPLNNKLEQLRRDVDELQHSLTGDGR